MKKTSSKQTINRGASHKPMGRGKTNMSSAGTDNYSNNYGKKLQPGANKFRGY